MNAFNLKEHEPTIAEAHRKLPPSSLDERAKHYELIEHRQYLNERGEDHPFVLSWRWGGKLPPRRSSVLRRQITCETTGL